MAPIHHHFEQLGWKEVKVVRIFVGITILMCIITKFIKSEVSISEDYGKKRKKINIYRNKTRLYINIINRNNIYNRDNYAFVSKCSNITC